MVSTPANRGQVVIDYEELRRMSSVWSEAASTLGRLGYRVAELTVAPEIVTNTIFDPAGALRCEAAILAAALGPHGLAVLAARLATDSAHLRAVVIKEQLVDDLPARQVAALEATLVTLPFSVLHDPVAALGSAGRRTVALGDALVGYGAPFTAPLLEMLAPSARFRFDVAQQRRLSVDPVFGLPLAAAVPRSEREGGSVSISRYLPTWGRQPPSSISSMLGEIGDLENQPEASIAVQRIVGHDGVARYVVALSGMRNLTSTQDPEDLIGAVAATVGTRTNYVTCVREALDTVLVPVGAQVLLVGHSQGGIVAMDLAGDPAFNGARVRVTQVIAAGSPISSKQVAPGSGTRVLSIENVNDIVTHLDAVDPPAKQQSVDHLVYRFAVDEHDVVANHDVRLYSREAAALADSPNPLMIDVQTDLEPFLAGSATTTVFTLHDQPTG
jgi:pimeloyl-ACP methyl ester carboxylesterase